MVDLISASVLVISFGGLLFLVARKIPVLCSVAMAAPVEKKKFLEKIKIIAKDKNPIKNLPVDLFLQKFLSKIRVQVLRIEHKIANLLSHLRQKAIKEKNSFSADYLEKLKNKK